jgi:hypothetical protein
VVPRNGLLVALCTLGAATSVLAANSYYDGSWSGGTTSSGCFARADLTVTGGDIAVILHDPGSTDGTPMAGKVGGDGKSVVMDTHQHGKHPPRTMFITFKGNSFEMHGNLECGDVSYDGTRTNH